MTSFKAKVLMILVSCVSLLGGAHVLAATDKECLSYQLVCQDYNCVRTAPAQCTDSNGVVHTWNRLVQNGGAALYLGKCQVGFGDCMEKGYTCSSSKYFNANIADTICDLTTLQCSAVGTVTGCP